MAVYIYLALGHHAADMYDDIPLSHIILTPIRLVLTLASVLCASNAAVSTISISLWYVLAGE
jgi:hypothetical protein